MENKLDGLRISVAAAKHRNYESHIKNTEKKKIQNTHSHTSIGTTETIPSIQFLQKSYIREVIQVLISLFFD